MTFEDDRREANRILRQWIEDKTGTPDWKRSVEKISKDLRDVVVAISEYIYPGKELFDDVARRIDRLEDKQ